MSNQLIPYRATKGDLIAGIAYAMSDPKAQRFVSNLVSRAKGVMFPKAPTVGPQQIRNLSSGKLPKNKKRKNRKQLRKTSPSPNLGETAITLTVDIVTRIATSGTSGNRTFAVFLGYQNSNFDWDFQQSTQLSNLARSFQFGTILNAEFRWIPTVAYSTTGAVGLAVCPDVTSNAGPGNFQALLQKDISIMSDVKETCAIRYRHANEEEDEAKYMKDSSAVAAPDRRFYAGNLLWVRFETDVTTDAAGIGYVSQTFTIKLERLV